MELTITGGLPNGVNAETMREFRRHIAFAQDDSKRWAVRLRSAQGFLMLERLPERGSEIRISFPAAWFQLDRYKPLLLSELDGFLLDVVEL